MRLGRLTAKARIKHDHKRPINAKINITFSKKIFIKRARLYLTFESDNIYENLNVLKYSLIREFKNVEEN